MILSTDGRRNDPVLAATECSACGVVGGFRPHSPYRRNLEGLEGEAVDHRAREARVL